MSKIVKKKGKKAKKCFSSCYNCTNKQTNISFSVNLLTWYKKS